tara:strand:+ start:54 stop:839 length:786 start_codon:yes stop_codon:yes gene_type:complete
MSDLPQGELGYAIEQEDFAELDKGEEHEEMLASFRMELPEFNINIDPTDIAKVVNQGSVGSCQGQSLATIFQICFFLATGRREFFSAAAGYYLSQKKDGIRGDRGSTLSGGRWVATEHGMCLDKEWPYVARYNPREPSDVKYVYKLKVSKPFKDADSIWAWLESGLPVQTGVRWGSEMNREVVKRASSRGGGHSTCLWTKRGDNANNINSWGSTWNGDGVQCWTKDAVAQMLRNGGTFIGYSPAGFAYPNLEPVTFEGYNE